MKFLNNRKIGTRLIVLLAVPLAALVFMAAFASHNLNLITDKLVKSLFEETFAGSEYLLNADRDLYQSFVGYRAYFNSGTAEERENALKDYQENLSQVKERVGKAAAIFEANHSFYEAIRHEESGKTAFEHLQIFEMDLNIWIAKTEEIINGYKNALPAERQSWVEQANAEGPEFTNARDHLDLLQGINERGGHDEINNGQKLKKNLILYLVVSVLISFAIVIGFAWFLIRSVTRPVKMLVDVANRVADGNLNVAIDLHTKDEIGILASAIGQMTDNLNEVMGNIHAASEQVTAGSKQVSISSMSLSQGAAEQASSVEQLTVSLDEISFQTKQNAASAMQANTLAEEAKVNAAQGNERMKEMLRSMDEINDASGSISKIIKVIDEIAFQTNILALNAAVEAARAGQHGKGFAVVAEEVRNLAARSANAAKETTDMIEGSIKKVEGGTKIANDTAAALHKIVDGVAKVANLVSDIAVASNKQATGIAQVNQGINQVAQVVQTNSATSEESASASEELSSQAVMMQEQVGRFKLRKVSRSGESFDDSYSEVAAAIRKKSL